MSEDLTITLPDGSLKNVPAGSSPMDIAKSIGTRLADDAVVARVDGELWDLTRPFAKDAKLEILTSKHPEALQVYRHSTAHLLAAAVLELFPETQLGSVRPPTRASITIFSAKPRSRPRTWRKLKRACGNCRPRT